MNRERTVSITPSNPGSGWNVYRPAHPAGYDQAAFHPAGSGISALRTLRSVPGGRRGVLALSGYRGVRQPGSADDGYPYPVECAGGHGVSGGGRTDSESAAQGKQWAMVLAGPDGTGCPGVVLAGVLGVPVLPLLGAAVPGMVFTGVCVALLEPVLRRIPGMERCTREG